jgi:hypothetical protein
VGGGGAGLCSPAIECQGGCGLVGRRVVASAVGGQGGWTGPEGWDAVGGRRLTDRVSERGGCWRMNPTGGGRLKGGVTEDEAGHTFSLLQKIRFLK